MGWLKINSNRKYRGSNLFARAHIGLGQTKCYEQYFWDFVKKNEIVECCSTYPKHIRSCIDGLRRSICGSLHIMDHCRVYRDINKKIIIVAQPYTNKEDIFNNKGFNDFCTKNNIEYKVDNDRSWYFPKVCCLLEISFEGEYNELLNRYNWRRV